MDDSISVNELNNKIEHFKDIGNPFKRSLCVLGVITQAMITYGIRPILVGGGAVEFYTLGSYTTKDLDLIVEGREKAKTALDNLKFKRRSGARHWYRDDLDLAIEIPDDYLAGSMEKVTKVLIDNMPVYIIGIEDLLIDRLSAYKFWKSQSDGEWAARIMLIHMDDIDWAYLDEVAITANVQDVLTETKNTVNDLKKEEREE